MNDTNDTDHSFIVIFDHDGNKTENEIYVDKYHYHGYSVVVPLAILMITFIVLAIVGNIMVIMTILRHQGLRTRTNMFIINLAVADILVAVLDMPVSLTTILDGGWVFGDALCQFNGFTMALFLICSIHTLMYISIHKYISITRPFSRAMTPQRIKMMIAAAWIWSIICATGPLVGWNHITYKTGSSQCGPDIPTKLKTLTHSLFITTTNYIIPLVVMCFCYFRIFREIHEHMNRIRVTSNIDLQSSVTQQKKVSVTLFLVLACFMVCWTPFIVYSTTYAFMKDKSKMPLVFNPLAYWCGYMNSACNPVIYAFRSPSFRKGYKEIMCGYSSTGTMANSLSFRSRSARGSTRSNSNATLAGRFTFKRSASHQITEKEQNKKPKRMLSQTSWMSIPIIPYVFRSLSNAGSKKTRHVSSNKKSSSKANDPIPEEVVGAHVDLAEDESCSIGCEGMASKYKKNESYDDAVQENLNLKEDCDSLGGENSTAFVNVVLETHEEDNDLVRNGKCENLKSLSNTPEINDDTKDGEKSEVTNICIPGEKLSPLEVGCANTFQEV